MSTPAPLAPHRPLFAAAALAWLLGALWWAARLGGLAPPGLLPATTLHALLMSLGFLPLFIAGFAFTAPPRWLGLQPPDGRGLRPWAALALLGWGLLLAADVLGQAVPARLALLLPALALARFALGLLALCRRPGVRHAPQAWGIAAGLGACALLLALAALQLPDTQALHRLALLGLHLAVGGIFVLALQRLSPFLHHQGRRGPWLLALLLGGLLLRVALPADAAGPGARWQGAAAAGELVLAALLLHDALQPALARARRTPLIAQLWLAYLWLAASFVLHAAARLGLLPAAAGLHALALGFMGGTLLAMVSRVTAVQQGRSIAVDGPLRALQLLLQGLLLLRLAACLWPRAELLTAAAGAFALLALGWLLRYLPWLLSSRTRSYS